MLGPVRAPDDAGAGTVTARLSFDAWKGGHVRPAELSLRVVTPRAGLHPESLSPRLMQTLVHPDRQALIQTVFFSPDGTEVTGTDYLSGATQTWDAATGKQVRAIPLPGGYMNAECPLPPPPDGKTLYRPVRRSRTVRIKKDGRPAVRWELGGEIEVWDLATGRALQSLRHTPPGAVQALARSADGNYLVEVEIRADTDATGIKFVLALWDVRTRMARDLGEGRAVPAFAPDSKTLAAAFTYPGSKSGELTLWDVASGKTRAVPPKGAAYYGAPTISPDGRYVADDLVLPNGRSPEVRLWEIATGKEVGAFAAPDQSLSFCGFAFSPDSRRLAAATWHEGKVFLFDVQSRKLARVHDLEKHVQLGCPVFSPDGKWLAGHGQQLPKGVEVLGRQDPFELPQPRVYLFDLAKGGEPEVVVAPHGYFGRAAFSPDGRRLALGGNGCVWIFDAAAGRE